MNFQELQGDLFACDWCDFVLAHCISADCAMGAGIAKQFVKRYPQMKEYCRNQKPRVGMAIYYPHDRVPVLNLITKQRYFHKPTYDTLTAALLDMKRQMVEMSIQRIAMPRIGCGLDKLEWIMVREIIKETFQDTDIEIRVYSI